MIRDEDVFTFLVGGLLEFTENERKYPYSEELRASLNMLALHMPDRYPRTMEGMLKQFQRPVREW